MTDRPVRTPSAAHPITVEPTGRRVVVLLGGDVVAESDNALTLREASYPAVQYIPIADVADGRLTPSDTTSYCPYKGEAGYYHFVTAGGDTVADAVWCYPTPCPAVAAIAGHVAFYPDKVDVRVHT
ncbi:DUF427 domain-containing protein [Mycobacterium sp. Y57]|uniref:DUF427 domain-containing protein n=1 Tax=Mycolicibacterium xanthum TaxID=2796469 RepID=UPI001C850217|nr:DUF427 domain-containing protein [Mycolicibacterium xanthum]MBX7430972.1 DUF427 domain-containing protein [Mycolicibacterium xanthum]